MADQSHEGPRWWSALQAIGWIVERTDDAVNRVAKKKLLRSLEFLNPRLQPNALGETPAISVNAAPYELMREARAGRVRFVGHRRGIGGQELVPIDGESRLQDHDDQVCIGYSDVYRGGNYWSGLSLLADECKAVWPRHDGALEGQPVSDGKQPETTAPTGRAMPKKRGKKADKLNMAIDWLREIHPNGRPAGVKDSILVQDFEAAKGVSISEKHLRRADHALAVSSGRIRDK